MHTVMCVMCLLAAEVCPLLCCRRHSHLHLISPSKHKMQGCSGLLRVCEVYRLQSTEASRALAASSSRQTVRHVRTMGCSGSHCLYALQTSALSVHGACGSIPESGWGVETSVHGGFRGASSQQQRAGYALLAKACHSMPTGGNAYLVMSSQDLLCYTFSW